MYICEHTENCRMVITFLDKGVIYEKYINNLESNYNVNNAPG